MDEIDIVRIFAFGVKRETFYFKYDKNHVPNQLEK